MDREFRIIAICHLPYTSESTPFFRVMANESVSYVTTLNHVYSLAEAFYCAQQRHTDEDGGGMGVLNNIPFPNHSSATGGDVLVLLGMDSNGDPARYSAALYCAPTGMWRRMSTAQLRAWSMSQPMDRAMPSDEAAFGEEVTDLLLSDLPNIG